MRRTDSCVVRDARATGRNAERNEAEGARIEAIVLRCGERAGVLVDVMSRCLISKVALAKPRLAHIPVFRR